jgi:hypothetical protein
MQDDNSSADVQADNDIADEPLFGTPEVTQTAPEAPSETTEEATTEAVATQDSDKEADAETTEAKDTEATAKDEGNTDDSKATDTEDKGKPDPQAAYRAYQERRARQQAVEQQIDQVYAPKSQDELYQENIDQGLTEEQAQYKAEVQALREEMQYAAQRTQIAELNASMQAEAVNALNDFSVFNPDSKDYDPEFSEMVQSRYQKTIQMDDNGLILAAQEPLYDYYKQMADIYNRGASKGTQQGQAEMQEMLAKTEAVGGGSQGSKGAETLEEMGERLADVPLI